MKNRILLIVLGLFLAASLVTACAPKPVAPVAPPPVVPKPEVYTLKFQNAYPAGVAGYRIFERWAKTMGEMSGGRLDIKTFPEGGIVATFDKFDAAMAGVLDGFVSFPIYWPGKHPLAVFLSSYPYGLDEAWMWEVWFYNMGGIELARKDYERFGLYYVAPIQTGPNFAHSVKPLYKAEDWKGLKARYPGGLIAEIYKKAGASVIILPGGEIYTAMATGVIELGEFVGHAMNLELGLHEVGKYIIGPGKMHQPVDLKALVMNKKSWDKLPADLKRLLEVGARDLSWSLHTNIMGADRVALRWMIDVNKNVYIELPPEERAKFRLLAIELWRKWATDAASLKALETQILLMNEPEIGILDFPGIREEVEKYFPGLLKKRLADIMVEDFYLPVPAVPRALK
ncbi:MAG: Lactate-binding periplasmic protein [Syntrophomonadaceae bacterium]|nr:Lactate-binding periplasmic protein [Bacillota bacterium]